MTTQKVELTKGTRVFYHGDMANMAAHGTVVKTVKDCYGTHYTVKFDDGRKFFVSAASFSFKYKGHGGTRFVTETAYNEWRNEQMARFS